MTHTKDFSAGFKRAVDELGYEGDWRQANWGKPYTFLLQQYTNCYSQEANDPRYTATPWGLFEPSQGSFKAT